MSDRGCGLVFDVGNLNLGDYLDRCLPDIRDTVRQRTWERYEQIVRVHLKPTLGRIKLRNLTPTHVRGLYREKLDSGSSPRTVQYIHTTLRKALRDAVSDELIPRNVADGIKAPVLIRRRSTHSTLIKPRRSYVPSAVTGSRHFTCSQFTVGYAKVSCWD
jgi:integrase